ncbi:MAG: hypothetical protein HY247_03545 [archaeon]|nr:MAG: hypothetical protein HY247_03545 [archaeon]
MPNNGLHRARRAPFAALSLLLFLVLLIPLAPVDASLSPPVIGVSPGTIDSGQSELLSTAVAFAGGTSPYTCQWLSKAPGAGSFSNLNSAFSCDTTTLPSTSTGPLSTVGTWRFELQVTDSSPSPVTVVSGAASVTVNRVLGTPLVTANPNVLDSGESASIVVSWTGGTSTFGSSLYSSGSAACDSNSTLVSSASDLTSSSWSVSVLFNTNVTMGIWYCATVSDDSGVPAITSSLSAGVVAHAALGAPVVSASAGGVVVGQSLTISTTSPFSGGSGPYSCSWLKKAPAATSFTSLGGAFSCDTSSLPSTPTGALTKAGSWQFELSVTDSAGLPTTIQSSPVTVSVNAPLKVNKVFVSAKVIESGQSPTVYTSNIAAVGGTAPLTCQWLVEAPGAGVYSDLGSPFLCGPSLFGQSTGSLGPTGVWRFKLSVTDSSNTPVNVISKPASLKVNTALTSPALTLSSGVIDSGQSVNAFVSWSGGIPKYTVVLHASSSGSCNVSSPIVATKSVSGLKAKFIGLPTLSADTTYCAIIVDHSAIPAAVSSPSADVTVNPPLGAPSLVAAPPVMDLGQNSSVSTSGPLSGGTEPYTCQWLKKSPASSSFVAQTAFPCSGSPSLGLSGLSSTGSWQFKLQVADSADGKPTVASAPITVVVNAALHVPALSAPSGIDTGQSVPVTVSWTGGTSPYSVAVYSSSTSSCSDSSTLADSSNGTALSVHFSDLPTISSDTWFCAVVTDSAGSPSSAISLTKPVAVNPALVAPSVDTSLSSVASGHGAVIFMTSDIFGGTGPFTCQWLVEGPSDVSFQNLGTSFSCNESTLYAVSTGNLGEVGTWQFELTVTDSSASPETVTTAPVSISVS